MSAVGAKIRQRRTDLGIGQAELGKLVGVSGAAVSNWENGDGRSPSKKILRNLAKVLKLRLEVLLDDSEPEDSTETELASLYRRLSADERTFVLRMVRGLVRRPLPAQAK